MSLVVVLAGPHDVFRRSPRVPLRWRSKVGTRIQGLEQVRWWHPEGRGKAQQIEEGHIPLTVLHLANVVPMKPCSCGKIGLSEPLAFAQGTDGSSQELTGRIRAVRW